MWGARAGVQVSRSEFHTHIHLDYAKTEILSCIKKKKKNLNQTGFFCLIRNHLQFLDFPKILQQSGFRFYILDFPYYYFHVFNFNTLLLLVSQLKLYYYFSNCTILPFHFFNIYIYFKRMIMVQVITNRSNSSCT